jgi:hypothetical protein
LFARPSFPMPAITWPPPPTEAPPPTTQPSRRAG